MPNYALRITYYKLRTTRAESQHAATGAQARGIVAAQAVRSTKGAEHSDAVRARHEVAREVLKPRIARREQKKAAADLGCCFFCGEAARPNKHIKLKGRN